jgi:hypothetical protein
LLHKDKVGKSRGAESGWSIYSRISYWVFGTASRCSWLGALQSS